MMETIGELLPLAVAISISPLPIIAMVVLLMSPQARTATPAFLLGWLAAIALSLALFSALSNLGLGGGGHGRIGGLVRLLLGAGLLFLAYKEWRARPKPGEIAHLPPWLTAVETMRPLAAGGLGFGIYAVNPKNLTVGIAAGVTFGAHQLALEPAMLTALIYVLVAGSTVIILVAAYFIAQQRVRPWLDDLRVWLAQHNAAVMAILLLVIGSMMLGKGMGAIVG